jgi:hypothetical protein
MDFVYLCKTGENEELRYSIRSVLNSFPKAKIWVVGGKPKWYIGNYIEVVQDRNLYTNIYNNLVAICKSNEISNKFMLMNDDFFIVNKVSKINYFYNGSLSEKITTYKEITGSSPYITKLSDTNNRLRKHGVESPIDYEMHTPFPMEKDKLKKILDNDYKYLVRSMYGNLNSVGGKKIQDVKIYSHGSLMERSFDYENKNTNFLSTTDESFLKILGMLKEKFPNPSIFEGK